MTITKEGALASFYTVNKAPIKHLRVYFSPKQAGSGDPSPTNVRPIDGWTGLSVTHCGKNMLHVSNDERTASGLTYTFNRNTSGEVTSINIDGTGTQQNGNYFTNLNYDSTAANIIPADQIISGGSSIANIVMNGRIQYMSDVTANEYYIDEATAISRNLIGRSYRIQLVPYPYLDAYNNEIHTIVYPMVRHANDIDPTFEPYSGTTIPIDWSLEAGILYGGYVDLITGELYKIWENINISTASVSIDLNLKGVDRYYISTPNAKRVNNSSTGYILCDCFTPAPILSSNENYSTNVMCTINTSPQRVYFYTPNGTFSDQDSFKNYMADKTFLYELESPQLISTLNPIELQAFFGRNNIWSNANRVEVEYDLAESNDELYKRRNILLRSAPHQVTVSGSFVHFETDIAAPLIITGTGNITICGKNIYDISAYPLEGPKKWISGGTGNVNDSGDSYYCTVAYIPVGALSGNQITLNHRPGGANPGFGFYNANKSFLSGISNSNGGTIGDPWTLSIPNNAHYMRFTCRNTYINECMICYGTDSGTFEAYTGTTAPAGTARKSLVGINNIWSDSGNITVTYWTH